MAWETCWLSAFFLIHGMELRRFVHDMGRFSLDRAEPQQLLGYCKVQSDDIFIYCYWITVRCNQIYLSVVTGLLSRCNHMYSSVVTGLLSRCNQIYSSVVCSLFSPLIMHLQRGFISCVLLCSKWPQSWATEITIRSIVFSDFCGPWIPEELSLVVLDQGPTGDRVHEVR